MQSRNRFGIWREMGGFSGLFRVSISERRNAGNRLPAMAFRDDSASSARTLNTVRISPPPHCLFGEHQRERSRPNPDALTSPSSWVSERPKADVAPQPPRGAE